MNGNTWDGVGWTDERLRDDLSANARYELFARVKALRNRAEAFAELWEAAQRFEVDGGVGCGPDDLDALRAALAKLAQGGEK